MKVRKARPEDFAGILKLTASLGLDYPGLENDRAWVAEEDARKIGAVALKRHKDCEELVSLAVDPSFRGQGLGRRLVQSLLKSAPGDIYLATIIPDFFKRCGFNKAEAPPPGMKKDPAWCEGCPKERCTVMVRKSG